MTMTTDQELIPRELRDKLKGLENGQQAPAPEEGTPAPVEEEPTPQPQPETPPQNTEVTPPSEEAPAPAPQPTPVPTEDPNSDSYQQRYRVLMGKYNAETRQLRSQLAEMDAKIQELQNQPSQAPQQAAPAVPTPAPEPRPVAWNLDAAIAQISDADVQKVISPQLIDDYGMPYWKQHLAMKQMPAAEEPVQTPAERPVAGQPDDSRIEALEATVKKQQKDLQKQAEDQFYKDLASMAPDWQEVNESDTWLDWLALGEPLTGRMYDDLLQEAVSGRDALRVVNLMDEYRKTLPPSSPPDNGSPSLESQVVPESGGAPPQQDVKPTMSLKQWQSEMQDLNRGELSPEAARKKQDKLMAMYREGRVTE